MTESEKIKRIGLKRNIKALMWFILAEFVL
jgi:hypothetical protein